jgi:alpha-ketoglutarate-dependent taurine dioxygenase
MRTFKHNLNKRRAIQDVPEFRDTLWPEPDGFVHIVTPESQGIDPVHFVRTHKDRINDWLKKDGACLLRGFDIQDASTFASTVSEFGTLLPYIERAAKRVEIVPGILTSTEMAPNVIIPQHHEMSYSDKWPERVYFWCQLPSPTGGRTPLTSERLVTSKIDPTLRKKFEEHGLRYIRNFNGHGIDLSWSDTFGTESREEVEQYARESNFEVFWNADGRLRTERKGPATVVYPETGENLWFNHAHLFHPTNLSTHVRSSLMNEFGIENLPRNVVFGNGETIPDQEILAIREVYEQNTVSFDWQKGDLLLLNNFLVTHGRETFSGDRKILVAMTDLYQLDKN